MAKYFLDTEFHEYQLEGINTIELISIALVDDAGNELYLLCKEFNVGAAFFNDWLRANVLKPIFEEIKFHPRAEFKFQDFSLSISEKGLTKTEIKEKILEFIGNDENPEFYGYYADYDWVVFCWLFGRMIDLPKHFPMYCRDLKQMFDEQVAKLNNRDFLSHFDNEKPLTLEEKIKLIKEKNPKYPKQENEHNALSDVRWNKALYEFLGNLE